MGNLNEAQIKKFVEAFSGNNVKTVDIQGRVGALEGDSRAAALEAIRRIPDLPYKICQGLAWETKPEEFTLALELIDGLTPIEQRSVLTLVVAQLQSSDSLAKSPVVQQAIKSVRDNERILPEVRHHTLLLKYLQS
ncbi:MAG TPA: hypothetical protein VFZ48_00875 [Candidatus Saccharimonadales bacterium]